MRTELSWADRRVTGALWAVRERQPLVHCITNIVVAGFTANVLLAVGASPAMVENEQESAEFAAMAGALLVNLGTLSRERDEAMRAAAFSAHASSRPWVLDPVAVGALAHRSALASELLAAAPTVVRGNASEVMSLAGASAAGRGVDSLTGSHEALDHAVALAAERGCVVSVSGEVDYVTDGTDVVEIPGGDVMMTRVTGVGCALGALVAAVAAVEDDPLLAASAASAVLAHAGAVAATGRPGPGSYAVALLDALGAMADGVSPPTR